MASTRTRSALAADEAGAEGISRKRRCELLGVPRAGSYYEPAQHGALAPEEAEAREARMAIIDEVHLEQPAAGARKMARECTKRGYKTTRYQAGRLMAEMNIRAIYPKPDTSRPAKEHKRFPYPLRGMKIWLPNQVWATDITYIRMGRTHMHLTAVIDRATRMIVGWGLSDTLEAAPATAVFEAAIERHGVPSIANSDQGSTFTAGCFVDMLASHGVRQSMDGKARWVDNVVMERWFRTLKSEWLRLQEYETPRELRDAIARFIDICNNKRLHQSLDHKTPAECYYEPFAQAA